MKGVIRLHKVTTESHNNFKLINTDSTTKGVVL